MKTRINFRPNRLRRTKRRIGCLDVKTGKVTTSDGKVYDIENIEKYDKVGYFETCENGKVIKKSGKVV